MKKFVKQSLAVLMAFSVTACANNEPAPTEATTQNPTGGVFDVTAAGYGGDLALKVTIEGETIKDIELGEARNKRCGGSCIPNYQTTYFGCKYSSCG